MKLFFKRFGGKSRLSAKLPAPPPGLPVVEAFAGSAGYSTRHEADRVVLCDLDPDIANLWDYLIHAAPEDILAIPADLTRRDEAPCEQSANLVSRWFNFQGSPVSAMTPYYTRERSIGRTGRMWCETVRSRIVENLPKIRNWSSCFDTYENLPDIEALWIVDPPYQHNTAKGYKKGPEGIDYSRLAEWCLSRRGIVCVHEGPLADWLPFRPFGEQVTGYVSNGVAKFAKEYLFVMDNWRQSSEWSDFAEGKMS